MNYISSDLEDVFVAIEKLCEEEESLLDVEEFPLYQQCHYGFSVDFDPSQLKEVLKTIYGDLHLWRRDEYFARAKMWHLSWTDESVGIPMSDDTLIFAWEHRGPSEIHPASVFEICNILDLEYPEKEIEEFTRVHLKESYDAGLNDLRVQNDDRCQMYIRAYDLALPRIAEKIALEDDEQSFWRVLHAVVAYEKRQRDAWLAGYKSRSEEQSP